MRTSARCRVNGTIANWLTQAAVLTVEPGDFFGAGRSPTRTLGGPGPSMLAPGESAEGIDDERERMRSAWNRARGLIRRRRSSKWPNDRGYQQRYVDFDIEPGQRVLDIGSGGYPFPSATILTDRFVGDTPRRRERLVTTSMPFVVSDIHALPFCGKSFDFVYCSHVLQGVEDPLAACREIMRVGKRGYIATPTLGKDMLFAWARGPQTWHVVAIGHHLCFFEYSDRQLDGVRSSLWRDRILSKWHDPLQEIFYDNMDVFDVMFPWNGEFSVIVFRLDGTINALNAQIKPA